jgi:hypothetical protein
MTSQLNVDTIVDKAGSGGSNIKMANTSTYVSEGGAKTANNVVQGLAKLWCNLIGTGTAAITDSFNTASFTDHGSGSYSVVATNAMSSANYNKVSHGGDNTSSGGNVIVVGGQRGFSVTSTTVKLACSYHADSASLADVGDVNVTYFGDLA